MDAIVIRGTREHNLKNISLSIPRNALVVLTGGLPPGPDGRQRSLPAPPALPPR